MCRWTRTAPTRRPLGQVPPAPGGAADRRDRAVGYEVQSASGHDVRRDLARAVVSGGWGLLELRPMHLSLEEIFLSLTTDDAIGGLDMQEGMPPGGEEVHA